MSSRILVVGQSGLIARALKKNNPEVVTVPGDSEPGDLSSYDAVIICAFHPDLYHQPYREELDIDLKFARKLQGQRTRLVMLSSRKVYGSGDQRGASEETAATGFDTYGVNKLKTEEKLASLLEPEQLLILRIANVIGFEYPRNRPSFMGYILNSLAKEGRVTFDTSPEGRRDFLSDEFMAATLFELLGKGASGIYNVGSSHPVPIRRIAEWVIEGFGDGTIEVTNSELSGEFWLDCQKLRSLTSLEFTERELASYCRGVGQQLRDYLGSK